MHLDDVKDPVAILVGPKGRGSNMAALARACAEGRVPARVQVVISPREDVQANVTASELGLRTMVVPAEPLETYGARLLHALGAGPYITPDGAEILAGCRAPKHMTKVEWVCLAGYTRLLPKGVLDEFKNHVLNIHPALLPKYGGKGMYGIRVHEAVLGSGDRESGCTVHFVNEQYDEGAIILQRRVPVLLDDTPESLAKRVLEQEHLAFPEALAQVILAERKKAEGRGEG